MIYLALGAAIIALGMYVYRRAPGLQRGRWRVGSGLIASAAIGAGGLLGARGEWIPAGVLVVVGFALAGAARSARGPAARPSQPPVRPSGMSAAEARAMLGVGEGATTEDIQAAYSRLMQRVHPDKGGAAGLAAQLNAARDRLLKGR